MITTITHVVALLLGALAGYLVLRNNPKVKAALDSKTDEVESKIKD